ncbi:MAG: hypothetical protein Q9222_006063 [Ikaeria aurantiellina]
MTSPSHFSAIFPLTCDPLNHLACSLISDRCIDQQSHGDCYFHNLITFISSSPLSSHLSPEGFCRAGRYTPFFANTISCIRQTCNANQPFDPVTLLTPWLENCKKPVYPDIIASASALARQDSGSDNSLSSPSTTTQPSPTVVKAGGVRPANNIAATGSAASSTHRANVITTTYLGIATNANGQQETFTVPALVGFTETVFGNPVTTVTGTATPTSIITLPWPTLPVGYFSAKHSLGGAARSSLGGTKTQQASGSTSVIIAVAFGTSGTSGAAQTGAAGGNGGTVLDSGSEQRPRGAKSLLGLMVVLLVGVVWF